VIPVKVSIIITAHNYGKYVSQALESALNQNFNESFEIIVVNDGSTDYTSSILEKFESDSRVRILTLEGLGLAKACNAGIEVSRGEYIIRLDADDWFDENILLVEASILDRRPEIGMVYPDYYLVDQYGSIMNHVRMQKVNDEVYLLDRNALAAGALYRKSCYEALNGYTEELRYQEDYDFWLRFTELFNVYNVNLPLMYYRKHAASMSTNLAPRLQSRRRIKDSFVVGKSKPEVLVVIPVKSRDWEGRNNLALKEMAGKPVLEYTIKAALAASNVSRVIVSTDNEKISKYAVSCGAEAPFLRPKKLTMHSSPLRDTLMHALEYFASNEKYYPEYVLQLQYISPLRRSEHIEEAINTMLIYKTDSVISVTKDTSFHWRPSQYGLEPVIWRKRLLRKDKDTVYRENGSIYLYNVNTLYEKEWLGESVGHIEMLPEESYRIFNKFDFWMCEAILSSKTEFYGEVS
jgi:CMP-N-acetylneuraminic acid synthetase